MCEFISAMKDKDTYFYLTKKDLKGKIFKEFKEDNYMWMWDICGHGAINFFYPEVKGIHWECSDFSTPNNFPKYIVEDIKKGMFEGIGICEEILNEEGLEEYQKIEQPAWKKYQKIQQPSWKKHQKIPQHALEKYQKIRQSAFWKIAVQKKYRKKIWK